MRLDTQTRKEKRRLDSSNDCIYRHPLSSALPPFPILPTSPSLFFHSSITFFSTQDTFPFKRTLHQDETCHCFCYSRHVQISHLRFKCIRNQCLQTGNRAKLCIYAPPLSLHMAFGRSFTFSFIALEQKRDDTH